MLLLISALAVAPALAAKDAGLAFVLGPGSHLALGEIEVSLPEGARLELLVSGEKSDGRFPVRLSPGGLTLREIDLGKDDQRLRVRIDGLSTGWLAPEANRLAAELTVTVQVEVGNGVEASSGEYALTLTTGAVEHASADAESNGDAIGYTSRTARLVAASTVAADSPLAAGEPLSVVLVGTFEGLPADLR